MPDACRDARGLACQIRIIAVLDQPFPSNALSDRRNSGWAYIVSFGDDREAFVKARSPDCADLFFRKLAYPFASRCAAMALSIGAILLMRCPSQVILFIVSRVAIPVGDFMSRSWLRAIKHFTNKNVNIFPSFCSILGQNYLWVWKHFACVSGSIWTHKMPTNLRAIVSPYATEIAHFIFRPRWDRAPLFLHAGRA